MMQYIARLYYYCRYNPQMALILLAAALVFMCIVSTAYKHTKGHGTLMLLFLGVDFVLICAMVPSLFVSGADIMKDEFKEMHNEFEVQCAAYTEQQNAQATNKIYEALANAGLPVD